MAVHVPLSVEAQMEARMLMLAPNNIFALERQADHHALAGHHAGLLLSDAESSRREKRPASPLFADASKWNSPSAEGAIGTHSRIRFKNPDYG